MKATTGVSLPALFLMAALLPAAAQKVPVVEKQLANGMRLLMVERHDDPSVAGGWVAHVGSSNEKPGLTGIAHLFEHMMFKGTPTLGTKDYRQDLEIIAEQERVRDEMRREEKLMRERYRRGELTTCSSPKTKPSAIASSNSNSTSSSPANGKSSSRTSSIASIPPPAPPA
jgi:hypothetical protein